MVSNFRLQYGDGGKMGWGTEEGGTSGIKSDKRLKEENKIEVLRFCISIFTVFLGRSRKFKFETCWRAVLSLPFFYSALYFLFLFLFLFLLLFLFL